jgi:invasion protein IalB
MSTFSGDRFARARFLAGLLALALLTGLSLPSAAFAQGAVKSVHDDWQIRCETPPGAQNEQCALFQSVVAEDRANVGLTVLVLRTADQKTRLMRVQVPLGVLLPAGLGLKVDDTPQRQDGDFLHLPDARGRDRLSHEPQGLWRGLRQASLTPMMAKSLSPSALSDCPTASLRLQ